MRSLFLLSLLARAFSGFAQEDTLLLRSAFHFLQTDDFRVQLRAWSDSVAQLGAAELRAYPAKTRRNAARARQKQIELWTASPCFVPDSNYYVAIRASRAVYMNDTLTFQRYDTLPFRAFHPPCARYRIVSFKFLSARVIELEHFRGSRNMRMRFGELYRVRLLMEGAGPRVIGMRFVYLN